MSSIGIITVSSAYLSETKLKENNIGVVDLNIVYDDKSVKETELLNNELFTLIDSGVLVKTSQPSPAQYLEVIESIAHLYDKIIIVVISKELSGAYNSALIASELYEGDLEISVIDSKTAALGTEYVIDEILEDVEKGVSFENILSSAREFTSKLKTFLVIDDLSILVQSGRLKISQLVIGNLLKIKPLLKLNSGKIEIFKKIRTQKKVYDKIVELIYNDNLENKVRKVYITYAIKKEYALSLKKSILEKISDVEVIICEPIGPVLSVHLGRGGIGVSW